jgi:hypothetical protein
MITIRIENRDAEGEIESVYLTANWMFRATFILSAQSSIFFVTVSWIKAEAVDELDRLTYFRIA